MYSFIHKRIYVEMTASEPLTLEEEYRVHKSWLEDEKSNFRTE
jgi:hypothetical protein